jgi:hypothetical protein
MFVLDALFDQIHQILSNVEIIGILVRRSPISAIDVRVGRKLVKRRSARDAAPGQTAKYQL